MHLEMLIMHFKRFGRDNRMFNDIIFSLVK